MTDREAIAEVLAAYCRLLDEMRLEELAALFTPDAEVSYGPVEPLRARGRLAIEQSLGRMWRWARTSHHLSNVEIRQAAPDRAEAVSYVLAWHERADGTTATVFGRYEDGLEREAGRWLIARRRMLMHGSDAGFTVPLHRLDRHGPPAGWVNPMPNLGQRA